MLWPERARARMDADSFWGVTARNRHVSAGPIVRVPRALDFSFGADCVIGFSGAEDVVLIDMAVKTGRPFSVFCLDTGRLHPKTYEFIERVRTNYAIENELFTPQPTSLQSIVKIKALFSFYEDGHQECCAIREVEPLGRAPSNYRAWVTGQRREQSPTR